MTPGLSLELYGVRVDVSAPAEMLGEIRAKLPYAREVADAEAVGQATQRRRGVDFRMGIASVGQGRYVVSRDGDELLKATREGIIGYLETQVRQQVSMRSPEKIFVHAGVVGMGDRAIIIAGPSHSGKTTLVAALIRAGASYFSDEYAVLDIDGLAHPFVKPLSIRNARGEADDHPVDALGGRAAASPLPVGLVVLSSHRAGATWRPTRLSDGDAVLALLRHTAQARERPADSLAALRHAVQGATVLQGERGEADELVPFVLDALTD